MKLKEEWNKRIQIWIKELQNHFYIELESVLFEGMFTKERLKRTDAMKCDGYKPMQDGMKWGRKWEYGWFRSVITMPKEAIGKRIVLKLETGGEALVYINNMPAGARDLEHNEITLTMCAKAGEQYHIAVESYAGHGLRLEGGGPCPKGRVIIPEPPQFQAVISKSTFGIWNEDAFWLYMDAITLERLYQSLDEKSLRAMKIRSGLEEFTKVVQFEVPYEERIISFKAGRDVLKPLLLCNNGSTMPVYTIFGQSHLDLAWKWPWEETIRKCARTFSNQLALMSEYDEYKFLLCEPPIMEALKENYSDLYEKVVKKVKEGKFIPEGGVYIECDTNLPSGESLIRQCVWGKKWFFEEYGIDTLMAWLPDCFGFSGQLPQIFTKSGIKYFATQKIARALKGAEVFPYNIFMWEGIDGSKILTHFYKKNNSRIDPYLLNERWFNDRVQQEDIDTFLFPFGYGDGGGGPIREMLETTKRISDLEGIPRTVMESPIAFFDRIAEKGVPKNKYTGEIYLAWHRGTLTAQAGLKQGNRRAETALRELEFWYSILFADISKDLCTTNYQAMPMYKAEIHDLWKSLLFNQFHDILPGTSIERVNEEANESYKNIIAKSIELCDEVINRYIINDEHYNEKGMSIFNSLSWERTCLIELPDGFNGAMDYEHNELLVQMINNAYYVKATIPPCGYAVVFPKKVNDLSELSNVSVNKSVNKSNNMPNNISSNVSRNISDNICDNKIDNQSGIVNIYETEKGYIMENDFIRICLDLSGCITSIYDKESDIEFANGTCNDIRMYQDINIDYDAWELSSFYEELPIKLDDKSKVTIKARGPLLGIISISRRINESELEQDICMTSYSRRIDFVTKIDWRETHKLLKVSFPINVFADEAIEEIQFGYVKRPTHRSRQYDADRYEVCNHKYTVLAEAGRGFAVLNDCKYGVSTVDNRIELSLLRAPNQPDMNADKGVHEFTYSIYAYTGNFNESDVVRQGYELNVNNKTALPVVMGNIGTKSLISLSSKSIILEVIKPSEDGKLSFDEKPSSDGFGDIILRLYESFKGHVKCRMHLDFKVKRIYETDMLESRCIKEVLFSSLQGVDMELEFSPFEIKTLRVVL